MTCAGRPDHSEHIGSPALTRTHGRLPSASCWRRLGLINDLAASTGSDDIRLGHLVQYTPPFGQSRVPQFVVTRESELG
jgi:hypothetical protein